jgi:hypothetical protein
MSSIFDLKTNVKQLVSANQGTSRMEYQQQPPTRDVTQNNFPNGAIHFRWQTSGQKWWIPNRSYIRIRCSLTKGNGDGLTFADNIAPNMGLCASLFQSAEFRINDKTVSRISDFLPQVDALETRLTKSRSWLNGVGNAVNFWQPTVEERQNDVIIDEGDGVLSQSTVASENLGFALADTVAVAATGVLTFAGAALPVLADIFKAGDEIEIDAGGAVGTVRYRISAFLAGGVTLQLNNITYIVLAAGARPFRRIRQTSNDSRNLSSFELTWTPPLSIFKIGHALPAMKAELILNPQTASVYQKAAIESILGDGDKNPAVGANNNDFKFTVENMYMYVNTVEGDRCDDITYLLDLEQTRCQSDKIDGPSFAQKNWDVSPSTYALTVAYQDLRAGTDTQASVSKFRSYEAGVNFVDPQETNLTRFFINYAGQNIPSPDADPEFTVAGGVNGGTDYTTQRYIESQIYNGAYYDSGGAESIVEYRRRGAYYYFSIPRDGTDRSTRVNVNQQFVVGTDTTNMRVLLFDHSRQNASIRVQDGRVIDVQLEDS